MVVNWCIFIFALASVALGQDIFDISRRGDLEALTELLESTNDDVSNSFDQNGMHPLMIGAKANRFDVVSALLEAGANVNAVENKGKSALYFAVAGDFPDIAQLLLNNGADPEIYALDGQSPLTLGMSLNHQPMVEYLQAALEEISEKEAGVPEGMGRDPDPSVSFGKQWGDPGISNENYYQTEEKIEGEGDVEEGPGPVGPSFRGASAKPSAIGSARITALNTGDDPDIASVSAYYDTGAAIQVGSTMKPTPSSTGMGTSLSTAHSTADSTADSTAGVTSEGTAHVTQDGSPQETVSDKVVQQMKLLEAARDGKVNELEEILKLEMVGVDIANDHGWTALIFAASSGQNGPVKALLKRGASVGHKENDGWTALMFSAYVGHRDVVETLLNANASVLDKADSGVNVLDAALLNEHYDPEVVTQLASHGLREAINLRKADDIMSMVVKGADLSTKGDDDWTALLYFASSGNLEGVRAVLDRCKSNTYDNDKSRKGRSKVVSSFAMGDRSAKIAATKPDGKPVSFGAACDIRTVINEVEAGDGWTALMFAASLNREEMVRRLLLAGSDTRIFSKAERPKTAGQIDLSIGKSFGKRMNSRSSGLGMTAISIALDRGFTYLADMIRRGDVLAQERAGSEIGRLIKFRALKETQAMEIARQNELDGLTHDDRSLLDPIRILEVLYDNVRYILN